MSGIRDVVFLIVIVGLTPVGFFRPWLGVLTWSWIAYMAPHMLTWGFGQRLPVAMMVGGATLLGFIFARDKQSLPRATVVPLLVLFTLDITMTSVLAIDPDLAWAKWNWVVKSLLMAFVTMSLFQDRHRLRWLYMVMALSLGFYGLKGGIWVLRTGGAERVFGPEGTFFGDNNELGLALCMMLPFLIYLSREESRPWLRRLMRVTFGFTIIAILFTYSRGALLGLLSIGALLIWRSPWRTLAIATALGLSLVITPLLPDKWWVRMDTIGDENADTSVQGRLEAWRTAFNLALDRPLTGGGFRALWDNYTWDRYFDGTYLKARDAHSIYFEVMSEHGFLGLTIYLLIVGTTLISLQRIRRRWRRHPEHGYLSTYADMTQLALAPYLVAGAFLSLAYFDLYLHLLATSAVLQTLSARAARGEVLAPAAPAPAEASPGRAHPAPVRPVSVSARVPRVVRRRPAPVLKRTRHA